MAVAFDASANGSVTFDVTLTFAHTVSGSDRLLLVAVLCNPNSAITGVTYNGVSMTAVETGDALIRLYALVNPATGSNNVVVTTDVDNEIVAIAASYTGVDQSTPYDGTQASATGDGSPSVSVSSATDNMVVGMSGYVDASGQTVQSAGAGQTSRGSIEENGHYVILSDEAGAASVTHSYTRNGAFYYNQRIIGINVRAAGGGDVTAPTLSSPVDAADGSDAGTGSVDTDEDNGTLYFVVTQSATSPSAAQVKAGQDHAGSAADDSGSQAVSGTGTQTISGGFTGLSPSTTYYAHYMHEDAATNQSSVSSGDGFTTSAAPAGAATRRLIGGGLINNGPIGGGLIH